MVQEGERDRTQRIPMNRIEFHREALDDAKHARQWYAERSAVLASAHERRELGYWRKR